MIEQIGLHIEHVAAPPTWHRIEVEPRHHPERQRNQRNQGRPPITDGERPAHHSCPIVGRQEFIPLSRPVTLGEKCQ